MEKNNSKIEINTPDPGYEPFPVSIMNRSTHEVTTFDPLADKPAAIKYGLNKSGCIRVRLVHRENPDLVFRTLQDWTNQGFGKYQLQWDGRDASGNIVDNKKVFVLFEAKDQGKGRQHKEHPEKACREPLIQARVLPGPAAGVKGKIQIRTTVTESNFSPLTEAGFEVRYYLDNKLIKTERSEKGGKDFTFEVDTKKLANGDHLISVNIDDLHDHVGSASVRITVEN